MQMGGHLRKHLRILRRGEEGGDGILAVLDVHGRLGDDALHQLVEFTGGKPRSIGGAAFANAREILQRHLHEHDVRRHRHQRLLIGQRARLDVVGDPIGLLLQPLAQFSLAYHAKGVRQLSQRRLQPLEPGDVALFGADEEIDAVLDLREIRFHGAPDGSHEFAARAEAIGVSEIRRRGGNQVQVVAAPRFQDQRILGSGPGHIIEDILEQLVGREADERLFSARDNPSQLPVEPSQQLPRGTARLNASVAQSLDKRPAGTEEGGHPLGARRLLDLLQHLADSGQPVGGVAAAEPSEQRLVKCCAARTHEVGKLRVGRPLVRLGGEAHVEIRREERHFGQERDIARGAKFVQLGQEDQREIGRPGLDPFEIVRQLDQTHRQRLDRLLAGPHRTVAEGDSGRFHLLCQQPRPVEAEHLQGPADLVDLLDAFSDRLRAVASFGESLERAARLLDGLVELVPDPFQRTVIVSVAHAVSSSPTVLSGARVQTGSKRIHVTRDHAGRRNPATDFCRSSARLARSPIERAVMRVPSDVWTVISWMTLMVSSIFAA